jgi:hypothetical protein
MKKIPLITGAKTIFRMKIQYDVKKNYDTLFLIHTSSTNPSLESAQSMEY